MGMTIDGAIAYLKADLLKPSSSANAEFEKAERLGLEALKRIRHDREAMQAEHILLLPGETEE